MRLIDGDYILEGLSHFNDRVNGNARFINGIETAKELIENAPTIDAIPVEFMDRIIKYAEKEKFADAKAAFVIVKEAWKKIKKL